MEEWFLGEIRLFAIDFAPAGWAQCNGQTLKVSENQALFSIISNKFGGDGKTTFQLPNLQGRAVLNPTTDGVFPVYSNGGTETHALTINEIPQHTHTMYASSAASTKGAAASNIWGESSARAYSSTANRYMSPQAIGITGAGQAHSNMQPYAVANFCIALSGTYPPKN
ncbi:hypothetical protein BBD42_10310 [Paenibacillus sp. BIHB 4019]|uniref:Phage tail collar domain-containing protein n=1 Tax=Paenibacillus sp. BIHB 4019 TaxID=1870819 RepID=A0A1B2DGI0_9BACL|nr:tail fiber protein [Paenibacillus sp. BIHB 4019]ANY66811.1 hypothetical protein BBD42_10310 [Paenibacillus sp. BIHB 4019]